MMEEKSPPLRRLIALVLLLAPFLLSGCVPALAVRELTYRPSPSDPYDLWQAYVTDSGLLYLCGSVDNGREGMEYVHRVYNLELRLEETLAYEPSTEPHVVQIDNHPSLVLNKGYLSDLCQFDEKRPTKRPDETGWTEILLASWDEGFVKLTPADIEAGRLPEPPAEPRAVLYRIYNSDPPAYLLMGRLTENGPDQVVLLVLGSEHIDEMW